MSDSNPVILRYRVWYDLSIHFVTRGLEFHQQLSRNSFQFLTCLLYTSDAADDMQCVDLGGRRIIKKSSSSVT